MVTCTTHFVYTSMQANIQDKHNLNFEPQREVCKCAIQKRNEHVLRYGGNTLPRTVAEMTIFLLPKSERILWQYTTTNIVSAQSSKRKQQGKVTTFSESISKNIFRELQAKVIYLCSFIPQREIEQSKSGSLLAHDQYIHIYYC